MPVLRVVDTAGLTTPGGDWAQVLRPAELGYCQGLQRAGEHLGARWLAKRVISEAIAWPGEPAWLDIEVGRTARGGPSVRLTGEVAAWCCSAALPVPAVSLSHAAGHAAALAWLPAARPAVPHG